MELFIKDAQSTSDEVIKKPHTASDIEHNHPSSLIELTEEDKKSLEITLTYTLGHGATLLTRLKGL